MRLPKNAWTIHSDIHKCKIELGVIRWGLSRSMAWKDTTMTQSRKIDNMKHWTSAPIWLWFPSLQCQNQLNKLDNWKRTWRYQRKWEFISYFADCPTSTNQSNTLLQNHQNQKQKHISWQFETFLLSNWYTGSNVETEHMTNSCWFITD